MYAKLLKCSCALIICLGVYLQYCNDSELVNASYIVMQHEHDDLYSVMIYIFLQA